MYLSKVFLNYFLFKIENRWARKDQKVISYFDFIYPTKNLGNARRKRIVPSQPNELQVKHALMRQLSRIWSKSWKGFTYFARLTSKTVVKYDLHAIIWRFSNT